ncbi:hypothetical protein FOL47_002230, partial [Perkinsus chesapeaki]
VSGYGGQAPGLEESGCETCLAAGMCCWLWQCGWFDIPLCDWPAALKQPLAVVRRTGMLGRVVDDRVYALRKLPSAIFRRPDDADWSAEKESKFGSYCRKFTLSSANKYMEWFYLSALSLERMVVSKQLGRADLAGFDHWWKRRHHMLAGGSSSFRAAATAQIRDPRLRSDDRPGKKLVMETSLLRSPAAIVNDEPLGVYRTSTKYEPGAKQRALYAVDDDCYVVTAYASSNAEKEMSGIRYALPKQLPTDAVGWQVMSEMPGLSWLSVDYSDYNSEHTTAELVLINLARHQAWLDYLPLGVSDAVPDKLQATAWVALSQFNSYCIGNDMNCRKTQGLGSGDRDTARNNTGIHDVNVDVARTDLKLCGFPVDPVYGDDEDIAFSELCEAVAYGSYQRSVGHGINPLKVLAGLHHHEYASTRVMAFELYAVAAAIETYCVDPRRSYLVCTDSEVVRKMVSPGSGKPADMNAVVGRMWDRLASGLVSAYFCRVASEANPADGPSRGLPVSSQWVEVPWRTPGVLQGTWSKLLAMTSSYAPQDGQAPGLLNGATQADRAQLQLPKGGCARWKNLESITEGDRAAASEEAAQGREERTTRPNFLT